MKIKLRDGTVRYLGSNPSPQRLVSAIPRSADPILPESQWLPFQEPPPVVQIEDQNGKGACNGHAAATALMLARFVSGYDHVRLSPWFIYAILCNGVDRGSNILQALQLCSGTGVSPWDRVPYGTINPGLLTQDARTDAARFKIEMGGRLKTWPEIMTAVQLRRPINLSICVGQTFDRFSREGVAGVDPGPGNHAVCVFGGAKRLASGKWAVLAYNSWGTKWGQGGFFWITEDHIRTQQYFEAYCIQAPTEDPSGPLLPNIKV